MPPRMRRRRSKTSGSQTRVYSFRGGSGVLYLLLIVVIAALTYVGLRAVRANAHKPTTRVIGPDDDPDFLRKIG